MFKFSLSAVLALTLCGQLFAGPLDRFRERRATRQKSGCCAVPQFRSLPLAVPQVMQSPLIRVGGLVRPGAGSGLLQLGGCVNGRCGIPVK